ncbi:MAG: CBS domain-containing protein [Gammaproteobacteria bacterium]|jgi:CBS domain-containing protein
MIIAEILKKKGRRVLTVQQTAPVLEATSRLTQDRIGALVVSSSGRDIQGIVSERDILHALGRYGADLITMKVEDIMTRHVETCTPHDDVKQVMSMMAQHRCRHMPVVGDNGLCGILSVRDIVKQRLEGGEEETDVAREALVFSS